jgi:hypothetical protein
MADADHRSGRDTRLLLLVILIALAVLFALARFRFPAANNQTPFVTTGPLERLAAQASYDDLAAAVSAVVQRTAPVVVPVLIEADADATATSPAAPGAGQASGPSRIRRAIGLRIGADLAVVYVPADHHVVFTAGDAGPVEIHRADASRQIAFVRLSVERGVGTTPAAMTGFTGFAYAAAIEAGLGGSSGKPVFIGRVDPIVDERWGSGVLVPGGTSDIPPGALVFTLDGRFIGLAIGHADAGVRLVPFALLEAATMVIGGGGPGQVP